MLLIETIPMFCSTFLILICRYRVDDSEVGYSREIQRLVSVRPRGSISRWLSLKQQWVQLLRVPLSANPPHYLEKYLLALTV